MSYYFHSLENPTYRKWWILLSVLPTENGGENRQDKIFHVFRRTVHDVMGASESSCGSDQPERKRRNRSSHRVWFLVESHRFGTSRSMVKTSRGLSFKTWPCGSMCPSLSDNILRCYTPDARSSRDRNS